MEDTRHGSENSSPLFKEALAVIPQIFKGWTTAQSESASIADVQSNAMYLETVEKKSNPVEKILLHAP